MAGFRSSESELSCLHEGSLATTQSLTKHAQNIRVVAGTDDYSHHPSAGNQIRRSHLGNLGHREPPVMRLLTETQATCSPFARLRFSR